MISSSGLRELLKKRAETDAEMARIENEIKAALKRRLDCASWWEKPFILICSAIVSLASLMRKTFHAVAKGISQVALDAQYPFIFGRVSECSRRHDENATSKLRRSKKCRY